MRTFLDWRKIRKSEGAHNNIRLLIKEVSHLVLPKNGRGICAPPDPWPSSVGPVFNLLSSSCCSKILND